MSVPSDGPDGLNDLADDADPRWREALALHRRAADDLAATAAALSPAAWAAPWAAGKWPPAIIVDHLNRTYDVLLRELQGGPGMAVRTGPLFRFVARLLVVPRLLRGTGFPAGARAPRETRPNTEPLAQEDAVAEFRGKSAAVDAAIRALRRERPAARITHAYFGAAPLAQSLVLCARHIEHHQRQLAAAAGAATEAA